MTEAQALQLFKCLADKSRLQILKSLAREDLYVERLSERLGLSASTVSFHLKKLTEAGAVTAHKSQYYTIYALNRSLFETKLLDVLEERPEDWELQRRRDESYRQKVLDAFSRTAGCGRSPPSSRRSASCWRRLPARLSRAALTRSARST